MANPNTNGGSAITVTDASNGITATTAHQREAEIIRQVEFYFGDDNLPHDPHLLGLFKEGKGWVSFNEITGFKKMRQYKPKSAVREALRHSNLVEVSQDGKRLRRKIPLDPKKITVIPKIDRKRQKLIVPDDKPWLTKGMLKPTGFETNVTDGPIKPEEYEQDQKDYDPEYSFTSRIETAVTRFCARRKFHQSTRQIFEKFMIFGGMDGGQRQFTGGLDEKTMEDYTKKEIAELTSYYGVSELVMDGLYDEYSNTEPTWVVDFEDVAKAFLSSEFLNYFDWYDEEQVRTATNVLRNFYNYLLLHDVCPEYKDQLFAARSVCDQAESELPKLAQVDQRIPGGFNVACSTLFDGNYASLHVSRDAEWAVQGDDLGWERKDAETVFLLGVFAHGSEEQITIVQHATEGNNRPAENATKEDEVKDSSVEEHKTQADEGEHDAAKPIASPTQTFNLVVKSTEELGLEITGIELASGEAMSIYTAPQFQSTILPVKAVGKLYCKRCEAPHAAPQDLPPSMLAPKKGGEFTFLVEDEILKSCVVGMKMECCVKEIGFGEDVEGVKWIDYVEVMYPSFYTWLPNENIREWKEPGKPREWMLRKRIPGEGAGMGGEEGEEDGGDGLEEDEDAVEDGIVVRDFAG